MRRPPPPRDDGAGRALPVEPSAAAPRIENRPAATRFAGHDLVEEVPAPEGRLGVVAAVATLGALAAGATAAAVVWLVVSAVQDRGGPDLVAADPGHDVAGHNTEAIELRRRASPGAAEAPVDLGPQPAPVTLEMPQEAFFHEMEVSCRGTPFRSRARVRGGVATVQAVPPGVACEAMFTGSEPVSISVRAGDHKRCTLQPTTCTPVR